VGESCSSFCFDYNNSCLVACLENYTVLDNNTNICVVADCSEPPHEDDECAVGCVLFEGECVIDQPFIPSVVIAGEVCKL
jgi:hypothetical protein